MRIDGRLQDKFDFGMFIPILMLAGIGLIAIYSSTANIPTAHGNFQKQLISFIVGLVLLFSVYLLPTRMIRYSVLPVYGLSISVLVLVLVIGKTVYGAKSWVAIGPVGFQPSEFAKIGLILLLAHWLSSSQRNINNLKELGVALLIGFIPVGLVLMEPDMGSAMIFMTIILAMLFWAGLSLFSLFIVLSPGLISFASMFGVYVFMACLLLVLVALVLFRKNLFISAAIFVLNLSSGFFFDYIFKALKPHQQKRIENFMNPQADPLGSGYNALQAKVAVGSGGLFGKGFMQGNQTQLRFIPEQWTDFIYSVIGEEFGFIGSALVVLLFFIILMRMLKIATSQPDNFHSLVVIGSMALLLAHCGINIGMNLGVMPVVGIPLPLLSFGGSSLLVNMLLLGLVMNIYRNIKDPNN